ncbi:MAG: cbb3-type cytochrome c oxidase subunit 3 [Rhodocyclaceae bacterium]|nr:cbb3-type cytochrome c oxidase subunit 3 [Rhodocyclaceae bacterium]MDZ4214672.1 cbb3-type cytochrome c oxidase subunit 3 [Rhodocyclaceae bacterium]
MDINDLRAIATVMLFVAFIAIVVWAYSGKRKQAFDEAALLAVGEDDEVKRGGKVGQ